MIHIVALNNWLQKSPEGNVTRDFCWVTKKEGPIHGTVYHTTANCEYHRAITFSSTLARGLNLIDSPRYQRGHRARHVLRPREDVSRRAGHRLSETLSGRITAFRFPTLMSHGLCCGKDVANTEN